MKAGRGSWARSNSTIAERAPGLSPELRDLLDRIFVCEEDERITIKVRAAALLLHAGVAFGLAVGRFLGRRCAAASRCPRPTPPLPLPPPRISAPPLPRASASTPGSTAR
jgi:hypothetical protein